MVTIHRPWDSGSWGTDTTAFIQRINGWEPQINELWSLVLDGIYREVHPKARIEVPAGTVEEFVTNYLAENGRQIEIIGEIHINNSIQFLGFSDQAWGSGLPFISNLLAQVQATG